MRFELYGCYSGERHEEKRQLEYILVAGAIQSLVVVECCDVCQPLELRTVTAFVCGHTFCASRKAWFKSLSKILL